jgi:mono/diheme cytochrome c family protein
MKTKHERAATAPALVAGLITLASVLQACAQTPQPEQPADEPNLQARSKTVDELTAQGSQLFLNSCAHCHGADAHGDEGPDLHSLELSDRQIANTIKNGIKDQMPSFAKKLSDADIAKLTAYLRTLS